MFCPECGVENDNGAKFCYNCGRNLCQVQKEISVVGGKENNYNKKLFEAYKEQIIGELLDTYLDDEEIEKNKFVKKAELYEMTETDIDNIISEFLYKIEKINNFIYQIYEEEGGLELDEDDIEKISDYCEVLGFEDEDDISNIVEKYNKQNKIDRKKQFQRAVLNDYLKNGVCNERVEDKFKDVNHKELKVLFDKQKERISKVEALVEEEYRNAKDFTLSIEQFEKIFFAANALLFEQDEIEEIIRKYEIKSGISEERNKLRAENFRKALNVKIGTKVFNIFNHKLEFDGKFFVGKYIDKKFEGILEKAIKAVENYKGRAEDKLSKIDEAVYNFSEDICDTVEKIKEDLKLDFDVESVDDVIDYFYEVKEAILLASGKIEEYEKIGQVAREYREQRKDSRARWQGGGFGVGGAIKGSLVAGAMNGVGGMAHSMANFAGNLRTGATVQGAKDEIVKVFQCVPNDIKGLQGKVITEIKRKIKREYPDCYWTKNEKEEDLLKQKYSNAIEEEKKDVAAKMLLNNPYDISNYLRIVDNIETVEKENVFDELERMSFTFDLDLNLELRKWLEKQLERENIDFSCENIRKLIMIGHIAFKGNAKENEEFNQLIGQLYNKKIWKENLNEFEEDVDMLEKLSQYLSEKSFQQEFQNCIKNNIEQVEKQMEQIKDGKHIPAGTLCFGVVLDEERIKDEERKVDVLVERLKIAKKAATEDNYKKIEELTDSYLEFKVSRMFEQIDLDDVGDILEKKNRVSKLDEFFCSEKGVIAFKGYIDAYIIAVIRESQTEQELSDILSFIEKIHQSTDMSFEDRKADIQKKDKELRTVLGIEYSTYEEAVEERKKTVGEKKFDTVEEAEEERKIIQYEQKKIADIETKQDSEPEILAEIMKSEFKSEPANVKKQQYIERVVEDYNYYKEDNLQKQLEKLRGKKVMWWLLEIATIIVTFIIRSSLNWIGIIVTLVIIASFWGQIKEVKEDIEDVKEDIEELKRIERLFVIKDGQIYLKKK